MAAEFDDRTAPSAGHVVSEVDTKTSEQRQVPRRESAPAQRAARPVVPTLESERFEERRVIGVGGSSVVLRALDLQLLRDIAIKVLDPQMADISEIDRFTDEARINGQLEHPNIVPVYELGVDQRGRRFLCMKLIEGETLEDELNKLGERRLEPRHLAKLLQVFLKVCDGVSFAHSRGVIHRDLKPKNIMISDFGQVYVLDWGIARLQPPEAGQYGPRVRVGSGLAEQTEFDPPGSLVGTACYMAPEQLRGQHASLDARTDVFALGATLYQVLSGQPPLTAEMVRAVWLHKPVAPIVPPEMLVHGGHVPPELSRITLRALAYDPAERYASVSDLQRDIEAFQRGSWELPRISFRAGSIILKEGEPGHTAYIVVEGSCMAYRLEDGKEIELRVMGPSEVFGETAVFSDKPRTASIKALTDVVLLVVTQEILANAVGLNSWMGSFVKALADRFREVDEKLRASEREGRRLSLIP